MSKQLLAIAVMSFVCASSAVAEPKHTVKRGSILSVQTQFVPSVKIRAASLTWQAYDHVDAHTGRMYEEVDPGQSLMATSFHCDADVVASDPGVVLSCKVPLDVADAIYYLTSISIKTGNSERTYHWQEEPLYIEVRVKGGERTTPPYILSMQLQ